MVWYGDEVCSMSRYEMLGLLFWRYISTAQYIKWDEGRTTQDDRDAIRTAVFLREKFGTERHLMEIHWL